MRHLAAGLLCALGFTAQATTLDYAVSKDPNGFNVYEVTKDAVTKLAGSPFGTSAVKYVWTDSNYIYDVNLVPLTPTPYYGSELVTYQMVNGKPKQVASLTDNGLARGGCGSCFLSITSMFSSAEHLFVTFIERGGGLYDGARVYHKHSGGSLSYMCNLGFPTNLYNVYSASSILAVRVDANEIYAYIDYLDPVSSSTVTGIYDISTNACKQVGILPQS